jgi:serine/threonine-protein kinase
LEHPGIVPVYELARRGPGQPPFYTMRFIRGRTLSEAVEAFHEKRKAGQAGSLDLLGLLNAFVAICQAVAYAHSRGVLHRDLKGQNVMLGDFGEVIVLDWGLAKLVDRPEDAAEAPPVELPREGPPQGTLQGQVLGTPAYMAPEQAAGRLDLIDRRTDVYGLGAMLYEILTGQPPFNGTDAPEVLRKVQEEDPTRPCLLNPAAPRALEAVCLRALRKKPAERYDTARALAQEVQRWLADEPVEAYREPVGARLARWAKRHKPTVAGAAALLLTAVAALTIGMILIGQEKARTEANYRIAEEQRTRAEVNFRLAREAVDRYYTQVSESKLLKIPRLEALRKELLQTAREFYEKFVSEATEDAGVQSELGNAYRRLATITDQISSTAAAIELAKRAQDLFERLVRDHPDEGAYQRNLAGILEDLGRFFLRTRQMSRSEEAYREALLSGSGLVGMPPVSAKSRRT